MQRYFAKVVEKQHIGTVFGDDGLMTTQYLCKVQIDEPLEKEIKVPAGTKGKPHFLVRESIFDWELKVDSRVLVDVDEMTDLLFPLRLTPRILQPDEGMVHATVEIFEPNAELTELEWQADFGALGKARGIARRTGRLHLSDTFALELPKNTNPGVYFGKLECADKPSFEVAVPIVPQGKSISYRVDADLNGFAEHILENNYLRLAIHPHFGASLKELWYKSTGVDQFSASKPKDKIFHRGHTDQIEEHDWPGRFWNAKFDEVESADEISSTGHATYSKELKEDSPINLTREIQLFPDSPMIYQRMTFAHVGENTSDEYELTYWPHLQLAVGGKYDEHQIAQVPTKEKLFHFRVRKDMMVWQHVEEYFGYHGGFVLAQDEETGMSFVFFTNPERINYFKILCPEDGGTYTFGPRTKTATLSTVGQVTHALVYAVASRASISQNAVAAIAEGKGEGRQTPVFLFAKHKDKIESSSTTLRWEGKCPTVQLQPIEYPGVGTIWQGRTMIPTGAVETLTASFSIGHERLRVKM